MFGETESVVSFEDFFVALVDIPGIVVGATPVVLLNSNLTQIKAIYRVKEWKGEHIYRYYKVLRRLRTLFF